MKFIPTPNQMEMIRHGLDHPVGLWFVEMGLSKTAARLAVWDELFTNGKLKGVLLVAPLRVATITWPNEIKKWDEFRWMRVANLRTPEGIESWYKGDSEIYIINYDQLDKFAENHIRGVRREKLPVDEVFFDEIDNAKSTSSKRIKRFRAATRRRGKDGKTRRIFPRWFGQTGTPVGNNRVNLFSQVRLVDDGKRFGESFTAWRDYHFRPANYGSRFPKWILEPGHDEVLENAIADIALVQTVEEWGDWEQPAFQEIPVTLPGDVRQQYHQLETQYLADLEDGSIVTAEFDGVMPNKLLQMCSGNIYVKDDEFAERRTVKVHDAKIEALVDLQRRLEGEPLLVGCAYQHEKKIIMDALDGCVEFKDELEPSWNAGKVKAMVAHPKSIGHGLNLQYGGSNVVWFTRPWSPDLYEQFNARLARRGQTKDVTVWSLVVQESIDQALSRSLASKQEDQRTFKKVLQRIRAERAM